MPSFPSTPSSWTSLLRSEKSSKSKSKSSGGVLKMFKLLPMLTTGCKVVTMLGLHGSKRMLGDKATTVTLFGHRRGRITLVIQEDTRSPPVFLLELPILTSSLHKEMGIGPVKVALESETKTQRRKLLEEYVWGVYVNGRKVGYSIRRKEASEEERYMMQLLRGVSMGAGVVPEERRKEEEVVGTEGGEMTYLRARFERVVGSKDSESLYMISPDGSNSSELSIFLVRLK